MTFEEQFNVILHSIAYRNYMQLAPLDFTKDYYKFHGQGCGTKYFNISNPLTIAHQTKPLICKFLDITGALALLSNDLFIKEYAEEYFKTKL